ncbi:MULTISPECIES: hypothetical protein [Amphritea]|uniref:Uncharacterized protein n=2 Tax=Amphritea TaxID=515417 RepID=A0A1H9EV25_9GAMM|nr:MULTISPECIES: hypothetical protein [Amphritea]MBN0986296.1 hypothetical protein [Amphritea pacifica]MBN1006987.1 hypothetical protein [Amphritea pacifica]SEQ29521.1 hypothetical protein SAMN03080615_01087 [Amphritea atlantica]
MKTNSIEHQIGQLMRDGHSAEQIIHLIDLPAEQAMSLYADYIEQRKQQQLRASNQHNQATYAMSLRA